MAQRATSLGPKPSLFSFSFLGFLFFFFALLSLVFNRQKTGFPPRKGHFLLIFNGSLSLSLNLFWPPPFSVSLSLSLCCSFLFPSFLSFFFAFFLFLVFVCFFPFLSSLLLFHEKKNIKIVNCNFFPEIFSLSFGFLSCFSVANLFFLSLLFPDFKLCFLFNINVFSFRKNKLKSTKKQKKKTIATKRFFFFMNLCFAKCQKLSFLFCLFFCQILVDVQKTQ